jgi:sugar lactone lactonase YvrE
MISRWFIPALVALTVVFCSRAQNLVGDEALSKVLVEGEGWQEVASGFQFTDAACSDAAGNFYFSDLPKGVVHRLAPDGKLSTFLEGPRISGLKFGPDGQIYACTQAPKRQVVAFALPSKQMTVLGENVAPNDLAVSAHGYLYFTETPKGQVTGVELKTRRVFTAGTGLNAPNGLALTPDCSTLAVSEYKGSNVWVFRVNTNGTLDAGAPYMTLRTPVHRTESAGDGMTVDAMGRYYVTSSVGIQMFDWMGRMGGVMANPQPKATVSAAFAGEGRQFLYVCSMDKVFRRKLQTPGAWLFQPSDGEARR